ncbi:cytochrome c oxidase accessory protein CcoG [Roseiconus lacunae]|uniref:Cytochrome c oxidase accessory protein CcoG n=1 Tax=Roseiconus lacunae TaxID=2605694 RepID=A0ABT7PBU5_9BACT|nr:cytochrome c oxidase accessory protein CcoG [Roseiconus lacunae]MCD0463587.1 cytochrome c oxidase accessory protein CcoG [Roseiconus lacunae]MDM4013964.1 cytochrome c oxidase accessory protein CcoG [Roseiconus lacunae]WRQ53260.1 cytochrome c oxidase accessory protein CcoG [Stieleria sp. HD01]
MTTKTVPDNDALLDAPEHVLSTLEKDGSRRWLRPRLSTGFWWHKRRVVAYILMVIFVAIPHLSINGKPLVLLDIAARQFTIFGRTFLPTDTLLLALLILTVFVSIVLVTAIAGRVWCGWACPQTVYMEFLFRPIDRLFEGTKGKGGKPRHAVSGALQVARFAVYFVLCAFLAHTFLAYFVGVDRLSEWVRRSPIEHPMPFLVMVFTVGLMLFDFMFFREQLCLIACPYGRFQSVMLDEQSMVVAYDHVRGEPRKKGKHLEGENVGDCVDCNQCVVVCPTGIDIRKGLQMECINCTQCIDACDSVMEKVGSPTGLIRYSSQDSIAGKVRRMFRARTIVYPLILLGLMSGLVFAISTKSGFDARIIRQPGSPFTMLPSLEVVNQFRMRLVNRTDQEQTYSITAAPELGLGIEVMDEDKMTLVPGKSVLVPINITFDSRLTRGSGRKEVAITINDGGENERDVEFFLLGPS